MREISIVLSNIYICNKICRGAKNKGGRVTLLCWLKKGKLVRNMTFKKNSKIQTPTQDLVPDTKLKICNKFAKFDTTTRPRVHDFGILV